MLNLKQLKDVACKYLGDRKNEQSIVFDPTFYVDNGRLYFLYSVVKFVDSDNNDFRIKRPEEWFLQDINEGSILKLYNIDERDFTDKTKLPMDTIFENDGRSLLYDDYNFVNRLIRKYTNYSNEIENNKLYSYDSLKLNVGTTSPKDYVISETHKYFDELKNTIERVGNDIDNYFYNNLSSLFNNIRNDYINNNKINVELIREFNNLLKYQSPNLLKLYQNSSNIDGINDAEFDKSILDLLNEKKEYYGLSQNELIQQIKDSLKNEDNKNFNIDEMMSKIDKKLEELNSEENN